MLNELCIENLAVIQQAVIPFTNDFNVFTGETGAGKSILINGINAVLGKRISKDIVRSGCDKAVVTALFTKLSDNTKEKLDEYNIDYSDDELLITRIINADGGSSARINSRTSSVAVLREIGLTLIDVHGQHDNQILMYPEKHIHIVDNYAELQDEIDDYRKSFKMLQDVSRNIKKLVMDEQSKHERLETLSIIINDISYAEIADENEDIRIENEFTVISNSHSISEMLSRITVVLAGDDDSIGVSESVDQSVNEMKRYTDILPQLEVLMNRLLSLRIEAADIGEELSRLNDSIDVDDERLAYLEDRRSKLMTVKKKYGPELSDVLLKYNNAVTEYGQLSGSSDEIKRLLEEKDRLLIEVSDKAKNISQKRKEASEQLSQRIEEELRFLDMPNVRLFFSQQEGKLTSIGMDTIEIMIAVNVGEPPKPIAKIASGGELSRIMLAIKNVIAEKDDVPTMIFDEIDTGVSGRAAQKIGVKLRQISGNRQVLCVTHLSQIAVMADSHLLIEKNTNGDRTYTTVNKLEKEQRTAEIARILCGDSITDIALKNAEEQLECRDEIFMDILKQK